MVDSPDDVAAQPRDGTQRPKVLRLNAILERLAAVGETRVTNLARQLGVSTATIRRDLEDLEERRLLTRTHGGAVSRSVVFELPLRDRSSAQAADKVRIAHAAAELAPAGSVVGLTGGTTTAEVARALSHRESLTVVTNALNVAWELVVHPQIKLVLSGGVARGHSYELIGPLADQTLAAVNLDIAFLGVDGVSATHGLTTHNEVEAHTNRVLIGRAKRVVVVADHSKIRQVRFAAITSLESVDELITDRDADLEAVDEIRQAGVVVTVV